MGMMDEKADLVKDLQRLGNIHVIPLTESEKCLKERPEDYIEALRYLIMCPDHKTPLTNPEGFDPDTIVSRTLELKYAEKDIKNRHDKLKKYIGKVRDWGLFDWPKPEELAGYKLYFYKVPHYRKRQLERVDGLIYQQVYSGNLNAYIVILSKDDPDDSKIPGKRAHFKEQSYKEALKEYEELSVKLEDMADERSRQTRYIQLLLQNLDREEDQTIYEYHMDRTLDDQSYFAFQGWIPVENLDDIEDLRARYNIATYIEEPTEDDKPPTLFKNNKALEPGEDLIKFYQMPAYNAWDPSAVIYFSFAIFFAMIMSDAGYALVLLMIVGLFWGKMSGSPPARRVRWIGLLLSGTSVIYGVMAGSYFGVEPPGGSLLADFKILDINDFNSMMVLSICMGVGHIMLANLIMGWNNRDNLTCLSYIGWIAILTAGMGLWLASPQNQVFQGLLIVGAVLVLAFTSSRPFNSAKNILMRVVDGLLGLTNVSKAFGDSLSYMRLFALGLTSASLAVMFNSLAGQVGESIAGMGTFLAILVLLLGHGLNFILAILGGVVHGLRLNLIEFFSWSLTDEGYAFEPFRIKEKEIWIT